jgi:serine/threonine protein kinase
METMKICPNCRKPLPEGVPLGLCPECLIKSGFPTGTDPGAAAAARFVPPPVSEIAHLFPQLEVIRLVGQGGMGAVFQARQPGLDRFVALKVLPPALGSDPGFAERFNREARALARLNHPNIVGVYDFGKAGPLHYLLMEFVDGANLREIEQAGELTPEKALAIVPQICEALQFAHNEGVVHRDIKPENLLLDKRGRLKITDFGIAKLVGADAGQQTLTGAKDVIGTPHYMAPEQIESPAAVDHRADIYSLGVVFYEMLTGELPLGKFQPPSRKVHIDVRLDEVVLHTLEKEPSRRYQQAFQLKTDVEAITHTRPPEAAPAVAADELLAQDYTLNIRSCLRRAWTLVRRDFWPLVGMSAFVLVVLSTISSSGFVIENGHSSGKISILALLLTGPLLGGLFFYFLKKIRGEAAGVDVAFTGFRQPLPHLVLAGFVMTLLILLGFVCLILPGIYLLVAWKLTFPLIVDKGLDFWTAMRVSRKIISKHWWKFFGLVIVSALINMAGLLALVFGLFIAFPITIAALMYAYEDVIGTVKIPASKLTPAGKMDRGIPPARPAGGGIPPTIHPQPTVSASSHSNKWPWFLLAAAGAGVLVIMFLIFSVHLVNEVVSGFSGETPRWNPGKNSSVRETAMPAPANPPNNSAPVLPPVRIKAGSFKPFTDSEGNVWLADQGFAGGETTERDDMAIVNTTDPGLYRSERYGMNSFSYPVPNGKYQVKLHFAETYDAITGPGARVFTFIVKGHEFKDFDVWATAGGAQRAYVETVNTEVTDGKLSIYFIPQKENPQINGIEILPVPEKPANN